MLGCSDSTSVVSSHSTSVRYQVLTLLSHDWLVLRCSGSASTRAPCLFATCNLHVLLWQVLKPTNEETFIIMVLLQWRNGWPVTKYLVQSFYSLVFLRLDSAGSRKGPQSPMAFVSLPDNGRRVLKPLKCNFPPWLRRGIEVYCPASVWWGRCRQFQNWGTPGTKTVIVCLADCVSIIVYERIYQTLPSFFHTQRRNSGVFNGFFFACRRWTLNVEAQVSDQGSTCRCSPFTKTDL